MKTQSKKKDVLVTDIANKGKETVLKRTSNVKLYSRKLYSRERQMPYSAWRKLTWMNRNWIGKLQITEAATGSLLQEKVFLEILQISQENTRARVSKNTIFIEHLRATTS